MDPMSRCRSALGTYISLVVLKFQLFVFFKYQTTKQKRKPYKSTPSDLAGNAAITSGGAGTDVARTITKTKTKMSQNHTKDVGADWVQLSSTNP